MCELVKAPADSTLVVDLFDSTHVEANADLCSGEEESQSKLLVLSEKR